MKATEEISRSGGSADPDPYKKRYGSGPLAFPTEIKHFRVISSLGLPVPDLVELEEDAGPDVLVATGNEESVRIVGAVAQVLQVEQALPGLNNKKRTRVKYREKQRFCSICISHF